MIVKRLMLAMVIAAVPGGNSVKAADCAQFKDSVARAACERQVGQTGDTGNWTVRRDVSALDDSATVMLSVKSANKFPSRYGRGYVQAEIAMYCFEHKTHASVQLGDHFLADLGDYGRVAYRFDKLPQKSIRMRESTDNSVLGLWGASAIPWIKSFYGKQFMVVRITPYSEAPIEASFNVSGLQEAVEPLRKACQW
jgi:type VI secretion system protein VasI